MKILLKLLKWFGILIGSIIFLILFAGFTYRIFGPKPQPPGDLVDVGGYKLHINAVGEKNSQPTVVIEAGLGVPSEHFYWLGEGLKDSLRVVRYDRAGIGYSDLSDAPRDAETAARDLHTLLENSGESPPYILAGHSIGGLYIRVFAQLYPEEVAGLVFIDSSHPDQRERLQLPESPDMSTMMKGFAVVCDLGIYGLVQSYTGSPFALDGLPDEVNERFFDYGTNGKYLRGVIQETKWSKENFKRAGLAKDFADIPIRTFTATVKADEQLRRRGIDPDQYQAGWEQMHLEIANLSNNGKHMLIDGHHNSIYTDRENAEIICKEILALTKFHGKSEAKHQTSNFAELK
ncbi:MAG: alpha/beta hydrolase [Bacteroidota bacterium]